MQAAHPILTCEQARDLEKRLFDGNETLERAAMSRAGAAIASGVLRDYQEVGAFPAAAKLLVLAGKGHNAGDALLAAREILRRYPAATLDVLFVFGEQSLRPLAFRAWRDCQECGRDRISCLRLGQLPSTADYDLCLDGIFGFQFNPPLNQATVTALSWVARQSIVMRAAVDLPSGLDAPGAFHADFTYATGSLKTPLLACGNAGRLRYLDLGFFEGDAAAAALPAQSGAGHFVLTPEILAPLRGLRPSHSDKRSYGHVFLLGGSRHFPGAILMAVLAALRSGAGLVTAFVPESLVPAFAARAPEAMWVGWPETPEGGLALEGAFLLQQRLSRASVLVIGPGLGREPETLVLVDGIVRSAEMPLVLDADALQPGLVSQGKAPRILTPHAGEFLRIAAGVDADLFSRKTGATVVLKGHRNRVAHQGRSYHSFFGGPVLARGGSGDTLAGMIGGLLAQKPGDLFAAAAKGVVWQGLAADALARSRGQIAVQCTDLLEFLPVALRARGDE